MKQYIYPASAIGLPEWPSGTLRLEGIDVTEDPTQADIFVIPGSLMSSSPQMFPNRAALARLPFFKERESRHVAFDCSDNEPLYATSAMLIRCNTRTWYLPTDPNTISWPWPVDDFAECIPVPPEGFKFDVSFQGWRSSYVRQHSADSVRASRLVSDIAEYPDFSGYLKANDPELARRVAEFRRSMRESRVALCPESIPGVFPYRFFEAMSAARVPVLVGSGYVLPFAEEIPYRDFCLMVEASEAAHVAERIAAFLAGTSDERLIEMGRMARQSWETWLHRDKWPSLMAAAVMKKCA